jgi:hypothetical protein
MAGSPVPTGHWGVAVVADKYRRQKNKKRLLLTVMSSCSHISISASFFKSQKE